MRPDLNVFPIGEKNTAFADHFSGQSYLNMLTTEGVPIGNVTFEPGCRNHWHIHEALKGGGQILLCTAGEGWYQAESLRRSYILAMWSSSPPASSTGTAQPETAGSSIWR